LLVENPFGVSFPLNLRQILNTLF